MFCEIYHCHMSEAACVARQRNAKSGAAQNERKAGQTDINCRNCAQGRAVAEKLPPGEAAAYSRSLRRVRDKAWGRLMGTHEKRKEAR